MLSLQRMRLPGRLRKRYDIINYFARRIGARHYLEIGTSTGRCLERVRVANKIGVDPAPKRVDPAWDVRVTTSDAFFGSNRDRFDLIFIDGLHLAEQVVRDIWNSIDVLEPGGLILLHDCNPAAAETATREVERAARGLPWNGDTWKAIAYVRQHHPELFCRVVDVDHGIGAIVPGKGLRLPPLTPELEARAAEYFGEIGFDDLQRDRPGLVGLVPSVSALRRQMAEAGVPR